MPQSSQGLTFTFNSSTLSVTNVSINETEDLVDATDLSVSPGSSKIYMGGFANDYELTCEYFAADVIEAGSTGPIEIGGPISFSGTGTVSNSSTTAAVGDLVRGSLTIRLEKTSAVANKVRPKV